MRSAISRPGASCHPAHTFSHTTSSSGRIVQPEMGILRVAVAVESPMRRGDTRELSDVMVDTGSEYTWIPRAVLTELGITV